MYVYISPCLYIYIYIYNTHMCTYIYIYIHINISINKQHIHTYKVPAVRRKSGAIRPVHLLRVSLLRVLEPNFPEDSLYNYMDMIIPIPENQEFAWVKPCEIETLNRRTGRTSGEWQGGGNEQGGTTCSSYIMILSIAIIYVILSPLDHSPLFVFPDTVEVCLV